MGAQLLALLVEQGTVELEPGVDLNAVGSAMEAALGSGDPERDTEQLMAWLEDCDQIAEIFGSEDELLGILKKW